MKKFRCNRKIFSIHTKMFVFARKLSLDQNLNRMSMQDYDVAQWCLQTPYFVNLLFLLLQATICLNQLMNKHFLFIWLCITRKKASGHVVLACIVELGSQVHNRGSLLVQVDLIVHLVPVSIVHQPS